MEGQVYGLVALAMALTLVGVFGGLQLFQTATVSSGLFFACAIAELAIIFTSGWWSNRSPLNMILFGLFPLLSGVTLTPLLLSVLTGYANGPIILINALASTALMTAAAAVLARMGFNLMSLVPALFLGVIGLLIMGLLQIFLPSLRSGPVELAVSGAGVFIFSLFIAVDVQRISQAGRMGGMSPFQLALSLYLDIYNLFVFVLRLMLAISGRRE
jgi:FtsH-binding integral membrane protein